ncbi:uncharacterized protein I206_102964 [Kwoniella pini CBS 10737]|uniref:BTB domain-containing protein n=1 Tax=Kwoniella pini CBS 10737 TaxID=1296096 RepID=A0A1B9I6X8_9TREE|nr:uncharacterized protein I206_03316 [Kwoniella pini CBS 10737]OCF51249.1 hypothetical protein I206_03316 [Kwoniella pini CBS 10737]
MSIAFQGKPYRYNEDFAESCGDLIILTSDGQALKTDSELLKTASPVFDSMLSRLSLDHSSSAIKLYLQTIRDEAIDFTDITYETFKETLNMCLKYETKMQGLGLLGQINEGKGVIGHFGAENGFELFCLMPNFNDMLTSCRIIKDVRSRTVNNTKYGDFWNPQLWKQDTIKDVRGDWVWAYLYAHNPTKYPRGSKDYWEDVSNRFLRLLCGVYDTVVI